MMRPMTRPGGKTALGGEVPFGGVALEFTLGDPIRGLNAAPPTPTAMFELHLVDCGNSI